MFGSNSDARNVIQTFSFGYKYFLLFYMKNKTKVALT